MVNPQQLAVYKNHHFQLRSSWAIHKNRISGRRAILDDIKEVTVTALWHIALPVTSLCQYNPSTTPLNTNLSGYPVYQQDVRHGRETKH